VALVCPSTLTRTSATPLPAGIVTVQLAAVAQFCGIVEFGPKAILAGGVPNWVDLKPAPVMVADPPPFCGPLLGETAVITGT
jgi:hypothetical protein